MTMTLTGRDCIYVNYICQRLNVLVGHFVIGKQGDPSFFTKKKINKNKINNTKKKKIRLILKKTFVIPVLLSSNMAVVPNLLLR